LLGTAVVSGRLARLCDHLNYSLLAMDMPDTNATLSSAFDTLRKRMRI